MKTIKLIDIASARSGDKNNVCNIGVMAKSEEDYATLKQHLTADIVKAHFKGLIKGKVERFEWDSLESLNFVCHEALDGGASRSMRMDSLGKEGFKVEKEKRMPLVYEDVKLDCGYRIDLLVEEKLVIEIKSVDVLDDIHLAQTLTYLKLGNYKLGLLINFNVTLLKHGIKRVVNGL